MPHGWPKHVAVLIAYKVILIYLCAFTGVIIVYAFDCSMVKKNCMKYRLTGHELKDKERRNRRRGGWVEFIKGEEEKVLRKGIAALDSYEVREPADPWKWENSKKRKGL